MKNLFIVSKNTDLSNYLFLLLKEITPPDSFSLSIELTNATDMVILDTETISPEEIKKYQFEVPMVLFAYENKPLLLQYTMKYDVNGIITLTMEATDLLKTLESASNREIFYDDAMISMLFSNKSNQMAEKIGALTEREVEIIRMMMKDMTNEEVALSLNLSVRTVNAHKGNIMRKVGAKTTSGLIRAVMDYSPLFKTLQ